MHNLLHEVQQPIRIRDCVMSKNKATLTICPFHRSSSGLAGIEDLKHVGSTSNIASWRDRTEAAKSATRFEQSRLAEDFGVHRRFCACRIRYVLSKQTAF